MNLDAVAREIRKDVIEMLLEAGSGHTAGSLGMADVMAVLYFSGAVKTFPKDPWNDERDRILLSNGHICPVWYAALARAGYFPKEELKTFRKINSRLQGHPHFRGLPGVENSGGPLGQGISQAVGLALAAKMGKKAWRTYCLMSDGELQEGEVWEAMMLAAKKNLDNLTVIVDRNGIQISGMTEEVMPLEPLVDKLRAFNLPVKEIDGNNIGEIVEAIRTGGVIIAHTIPGKGVDFIEGKYEWHGKAPNKQEAEEALRQLGLG